MSYASVIAQRLWREPGGGVSASLQTRVGAGMVQESLGQYGYPVARDNITHLTRKGVNIHPLSNARGVSLTVGDVIIGHYMYVHVSITAVLY
jgi:hypothetical protein